MPVDVLIPQLGESVQDAIIARWLKEDGTAVTADEPVVELETDKANVEVAAASAGVLRILRPEGETVQVGEVVARIEADGAQGGVAKGKAAPKAKAAKSKTAAASARADAEAEAPAPARADAAPQPEAPTPLPASGDGGAVARTGEVVLTPAARRAAAEHGVAPEELRVFARGGRVAKEDVLAYLARAADDAAAAAMTTVAPISPVAAPPEAPPPRPAQAPRGEPGDAETERVPMTRIRQRIAERLVQAQRTAAILTTFNEVDMSAVLEWRGRHKQRFQEVHGVSLGFVSFFAQACLGALRDVPAVNAQIDGADVVYHRHVHLGIAVASRRGLVVPVVRYADQRSFPELEKEIARLAGLARESKLSPDDLTGGTFTISNGGVFGSLLSTPILNPPQSGILGMHKTEKRPVVVGDQIAIRPMMYVALSYDHRLIDGEQAVTFLVKIKERIEDPSRMLFQI